MIYVTQGHEKGIGLEIFLKSFLTLSKTKQLSITLVCSKEVLIENINLLKLSYSISNDQFLVCNQILNCLFVTGTPLSSAALEAATDICSANDILFTLPTSKDQVILNGKMYNGHTEYFRAKYDCEVNMFFKSHEANVLLISDHIPLASVSKNINSKLINDKLQILVDNYRKYFGDIRKIFISGINPHSGENGLLGNEEEDIKINPITNIEISPLLPADSILVNNDFKEDSVFVYMYHDQGLAPFKTLFKTIGANISFGLPYLRLSVDHGTAFSLYGKGVADYMGCFYVMNLALKIHKKMKVN